ncbi:hypothetical protein EX30DRAFT_374044 [Ascodesmis nigricans]|uniref:Uncharacterized protein n=1 Tax=Ascodesmis nigricans TaxID=341454 RepID=A0A4S2MR79_9PEZI|nr:hypothetical protein EX30DRAFT_374044 [Ascodesmis nigricans]
MRLFKPDPQLKDPRNTLTISLLAVLVPAAVQVILPTTPSSLPYTYTTLTTNIYTYAVHSTATLASSSASAIPFSTRTATAFWNSDLTWITYHFSSEDVPTPWVTIPSTTPNNDYPTSTIWYEQTVLTAPSYCSSTTWAHTTSGKVEIPQEVHYQLTPITTITYPPGQYSDYSGALCRTAIRVGERCPYPPGH